MNYVQFEKIQKSQIRKTPNGYIHVSDPETIYKDKPKKKYMDYPASRCNLTEKQRQDAENYVAENCHGKSNGDIYNELVKNKLIVDESGNISHKSIIDRILRNLRAEGRFKTSTEMIVDMYKSGFDLDSIQEKTKKSRVHVLATIRDFKKGIRK